MLSCLAASPATAPSDLKARLAESRAALKQAMDRRDADKAAAIAKFESSPAGKELADDAAAKSKALAAARSGNDAQEKLDASAAFNKAKQKLTDAQQASIEKDAALRLAWDDLHAAQKVEAELEKAVAAIPPPPPSVSKPIATGMRLDEAVKIAGFAPKLIQEEEDGEKLYTLNVWVMDDDLNKARGAGKSRNIPTVEMRKEYFLTVKDGVILHFNVLVHHEG